MPNDNARRGQVRAGVLAEVATIEMTSTRNQDAYRFCVHPSQLRKNRWLTYLCAVENVAPR
jgi:hypothetical protein